MKRIFCLLLPAAALLMAACGKKQDSYQQPDISISITSPAAGQTFHAGDTLHFAAAVNSPVQLHGYTWSVVRNSDNSSLTETDEHVHEQNFSIAGDWAVPPGTTGDLTVKLTVEIDHDGHEDTRTVPVKVLP